MKNIQLSTALSTYETFTRYEVCIFFASQSLMLGNNFMQSWNVSRLTLNF